MKSTAFVATIAALTLCALASDAFATEVVPIQGKYGKITLDGICAANGGNSYGSASSGGYGCTKGKNSVECDHKGNCTGYIGLQVQTGDKNKAGIAASVLQFSEGR